MPPYVAVVALHNTEDFEMLGNTYSAADARAGLPSPTASRSISISI